MSEDKSIKVYPYNPKAHAGRLQIRWLKKYYNFIKKHYVFVSSFLATLFATFCYISVDIYVTHFEIDFFKFASFSDVYQVAFDQGVILSSLSMAFTLFLAVTTFSARAVAWWSRPIKGIGVFHVFMFYFIGILGTIILPLFLMFFILKTYVVSMIEPAFDIVEGKSTKYTIQLRSNEEYKGMAIIASVSDYIFIWHGVENKSYIIPKAYIKTISPVSSIQSGKLTEIELLKFLF